MKKRLKEMKKSKRNFEEKNEQKIFKLLWQLEMINNLASLKEFLQEVDCIVCIATDC